MHCAEGEANAEIQYDVELRCARKLRTLPSPEEKDGALIAPLSEERQRKAAELLLNLLKSCTEHVCIAKFWVW